jgi:hypothetical protein
MFAANFKRGQEREAQLCVYVGERMVVDLWGSAAGDKAGLSPLFFIFYFLFFVVEGVMFFARLTPHCERTIVRRSYLLPYHCCSAKDSSHENLFRDLPCGRQEHGRYNF